MQHAATDKTKESGAPFGTIMPMRVRKTLRMCSASIQKQRFAFHHFHQPCVACCDVERGARFDPMLDLFHAHFAE